MLLLSLTTLLPQFDLLAHSCNRRFREEVKAREVFANNSNAADLEGCAASYDVVDRLGSIQTPSLVVCGTRDAPFVAGSKLLLSHLRNVDEVRLDGVGHHSRGGEPRRRDEIARFVSCS